MSNAWETTEDDIINVLHGMGNAVVDDYQGTAGYVHGNLNHDAVEKAALHGNDMDTQTKYAYEEIERQIKEMDVLN
jgi:hypothetical protein